MKFALALAVSTTLMAPLSFLADYDSPTFEELARESTAIVDTTVVGFSQAGHANLKIHKHILGKAAPSALVGIRLGDKLRLQDILYPGSRYVIFLHDNLVVDGGSRLHVREVDGKVEYEYRDWRHPGMNHWMEPARFQEVLRVARAVRLEVTEGIYDPVEPTKMTLKCFIRNETSQPIAIPSGYHNGTTCLIAGGLTLMRLEPATERTEKIRSATASSGESLSTFDVPPDGESLLFELPLDEILIKDDTARKNWEWGWRRRPEPPRSPVHKWRASGFHDHVVLQVAVNMTGKSYLSTASFLLDDAKPGEWARSNRIWLKVKSVPER